MQAAAAYMLYPLDTPENQVNNEHANYSPIINILSTIHLGQLGRRWKETVSMRQLRRTTVALRYS